MIQDTIMAIVALAAMIAFLAVVPAFVPDIDLIIVVVLVAGLAVYDFWTLLRNRDKK